MNQRARNRRALLFAAAELMPKSACAPHSDKLEHFMCTSLRFALARLAATTEGDVLNTFIVATIKNWKTSPSDVCGSVRRVIGAVQGEALT